MNIAVLLAGGTGQRLHAGKPKQFVEILGKPFIVYALEIYQNAPHINAIEVVSVPEYIGTVWGYVKEYGLDKVKWVISGGDSCQESTRNGIFNLEGIASPDDMLTVNMSTSIFVDDDILEDSFKTAKKYGSAFSGMQCIYNNAETFDGVSSNNIHFKESHKTLNMPWTASFGKLYAMYRKAYAEGIETKSSSYMPTLFLALGETIYLSKDTSLNKLHVTTPEDLEIVTAILEHREKIGKKTKRGKTDYEILNGC